MLRGNGAQREVRQADAQHCATVKAGGASEAPDWDDMASTQGGCLISGLISYRFE